MSGSNQEARALRRMVEELRAEEPPALRWDAIERSLLLEVARRDRARPRPLIDLEGSVFARVLGFAAAAAVIALGVRGVTGSSEGPRAAAPSHVVNVVNAPSSAAGQGERDLLSLREGDIIEATSEPVRFGHAGAVAWTLDPGSRIQVRSMGAQGVGHTIALERGAIRAEVTPRAASEGMVEAFAVEVGGTRVAVHGTAFSVALEGERLVVDVEHGAVAVGPRGNTGITTGHLLVGPNRASFSRDGARSARLLPRAVVAPALAPVAALAAPAPAAPPSALGQPASPHDPHAAAPVLAGHVAALEPAARPALPEANAPEASAPVALPAPAAPPPPPSLTVGGVRAELDACFNRVYGGGSPSVKVSLSADIKLVLEPDGRVKAVQFSPPLEPAFQNCAASFFGRSFAEGGKTVKIPIFFQK